MTVEKKPTLTDPKGMGGINAQDGFDYQVWVALARLPAWLRNPAFEGVAIETLEDFEARFFAPHSPRGHVLDRFQAKSGTPTQAEIVEVLDSFWAFDAAYPATARVHTLVTPALPTGLRWIARDVNRVQNARPFYQPFSDIRAASDDELKKKLVKKFGPDRGVFFARSVEVALQTIPDRNHAEITFAAAMGKAFPGMGANAPDIFSAFRALSDLVAQFRGGMLTRDQLVALLNETLGIELEAERSLHVHIRSDRNSARSDAVEVDASHFSGTGGGFPTPEKWDAEFITPLNAVARWAGRRNHRRVALSGSYRLTTAFVVGWTFRSAKGFDLDVETRAGMWATDAYPSPDIVLPWEINGPLGLVDERLVVGVGILRNPTLNMVQDLGLQNSTSFLIATLEKPLRNGMEAQASATAIKNAMANAVERFRPTGIDLYYAGPAAFAVTLGHRWNALPPTQLREFIAAGQYYSPTAQIEQSSSRDINRHGNANWL